MRKDKLYFLTFTSIAVIYLFIASLASSYFVKVSAKELLEVQIESGKREASEMANLIEFQLFKGVAKEAVLKNHQQTIHSTDADIWFTSIINWSGKIVCHPDNTQVGQLVNSNASLIEALKEKNASETLYDILLLKEQEGSVEIEFSEVIQLVPIKNSDLIVAANVNTRRILRQLDTLETSFSIILLVMGLVVIVLSFIAVRVIGSRYEKQLELNNSSLATEVISLSRLNNDLVSYKEKIIETFNARRKEETSDGKNIRILTYLRNELVPILISDIAYIYTENAVTYIVSFEGKKSTTNASLDDLYSKFDHTLFFRANRQFIISISAIDKIIRYGNSQLKILLHSKKSEDIIISKNKAAEFKQWLNM